MPNIPGRPSVRDKGGGRGVDVMWNAVLPNNTAGSVLYLIQRRTHHGRHAHRHHDDSTMSPWQQIEQVTTHSTTHTSLSALCLFA